MYTKRTLSAALLLIMLFSLATPCFAETAGYEKNGVTSSEPSIEIVSVENSNNSSDEYRLHFYNVDMQNAYAKLVNYYSTVDLECPVSYDQFIESYLPSASWQSISAYLLTYINIIDADLDEAGFFDSVGGANPQESQASSRSFVPRTANYNTYNLLGYIKKGDIIYERRGPIASITGHIGIVDGIFWSSSNSQFYIRIIEASSTVSYAVFDDTRLSDKLGSILRVDSASVRQINNAVEFCRSQLGKSYGVHAGKHTGSSESNWYCSELVWAAYYNSGINLDDNSSTSDAVWPNEIYASTLVTDRGYSTTKKSSRYTDISGNWAYSSIVYVVDNGIMDSYWSHVFQPSEGMTRESLVRILYTMSGSPNLSSYSSPFSDVNSSNKYYAAVLWANSKGIVMGYDDGTFRPNQTITRQQMATFFYRYAVWRGCSTSYSTNALSGFSDAGSISAYAQIPMKWAITHGLFQGTTSTTISPLDVCTRAQGATITTRFVDIFL